MNESKIEVVEIKKCSYKSNDIEYYVKEKISNSVMFLSPMDILVVMRVLILMPTDINIAHFLYQIIFFSTNCV